LWGKAGVAGSLGFLVALRQHGSDLQRCAITYSEQPAA
jgi:hypothetical protein